MAGAKSFNVTPIQVVGAALAAMTAAFLGSYLGVAGTIIGAALTSVILTVGGALYQRWLEVTRDRARQATRRVRQNDEHVEQGAPDQGPPTEDGVDGTGPEVPETQAAPTGHRRVRWPVVTVVSALVFALAMLAVTTFELLTGSALSGGGNPTTVGAVLHPPSTEAPATPVPQQQTSTAEKPPSTSPPASTGWPSQQPPESVSPTQPPPASSPNRSGSQAPASPTQRTAAPTGQSNP